MIIEPESRPTVAPKEMLSVRVADDGRTLVKINFSSLDIIQTCKRKALYSLERRLVPDTEAPALTFGSAFHKGLDVWYSAPREFRTKGKACCDDMQAAFLADINTTEGEGEALCLRCCSVRAFLARAQSLKNLENDKRSLDNGVETLNAYFDRYENDPYEAALDSDGKPFTERRFELDFSENSQRKIVLFGTIDAVLRNTQSQGYVVCDHKTTTSLGQDFYNRIRPNLQFYAYVLGAQRVFGLEVDQFLSNGIQVAKTKKDFARQISKVTAEDFEELRIAIEEAVDSYLQARTLNRWPMSAPNSCTLYGSCAYRTICEVPDSMKQTVIDSQYPDRAILASASGVN